MEDITAPAPSNEVPVPDQAPAVRANASPVPDQASAALRTAGIVVGALGAVASFASTHDLLALIGYLQSDQGFGALSLLGTAGLFLWGQLKTRHRAKQLAQIAASPEVPNHIASLK